jgi:hypothetical protein
MKRRIALGLALPIIIGMLAIGGGMHSPPTHIFAAASTPPPPPGTPPTPIGPPPGPPSPTPTQTPIPTATSTPVPTDTPTEVPTDTPVPSKPTATPTKSARPHHHPNTGGGGTYFYGSASSGTLNHSAVSRGIFGQSASTSKGPNMLPKTGGGSGDPSSPLAPLALIGFLALAGSRLVPHLLKR